MAEISFNYNITEESIGGFVIDAFISEHYKFGNSVTDIPMEDGSYASDHAVENAAEIHITGFMGGVEFAGSAGGDPKTRITEAYLELMRLKSERQPIDLVTGLDTYPDMLITSFEVDRDSTNGNDFPFEMTFKQIRIIKSETTAISGASPSADQTAGSADMGVAATIKEDPDSDSQYMREKWRHAVRTGLATPRDYERKWGLPYPT